VVSGCGRSVWDMEPDQARSNSLEPGNHSRLIRINLGQGRGD
jgi:hypothetical protein